jgi:hypothetical protein
MAKTDTVTLSTGGIGLDTRDFAKFAKALRKADKGLYKQLQIRLRAAGSDVEAAAKANVEPYSSPAVTSIKTRVSSATVAVVAGVGGVPMAALLELGNKPSTGGRAPEGMFAHPVFGGRNTKRPNAPWRDQPMHPYLLRALHEHAPEAWAAAVEALDWAILVACTDEEL